MSQDAMSVAKQDNSISSPLASRAPSGEGLVWLRDEHPDFYYMFRAVDGDRGSLNWLGHKSAGLHLFTRALSGDKQALHTIQTEQTLELDDLFSHFNGGIHGGTFTSWLREQQPEWARLFEAIEGSEEALRQLKRDRKELARALRPHYDRYRKEGPRDLLEGEELYAEVKSDLSADGFADVGCLVGEGHLKEGEYLKAVEAFTRSIENAPSPDVFEGRARAYRALALEDEQRARQLREQG